jgi:hypothetical protein
MPAREGRDPKSCAPRNEQQQKEVSQMARTHVETAPERAAAGGRLAEIAQQSVPWLAGAGMALGHAAVSANCTVLQHGRCAACGSCILVVGSLAAWAIARKRRGGEFWEG